MSVRTILSAATRRKRVVGRTAYPLDFISAEKVIPWRVNTQHPYPTFLGFGEYNGHKTVKVRFTTGGTIQRVYIELPVDHRIAQLMYKRDKPQYSEALGYVSLQESTLIDGNADSLGNAAANVWYLRSLSVKRVGKYFAVGINNTTTYPVIMEFYLVDDLATI